MRVRPVFIGIGILPFIDLLIMLIKTVDQGALNQPKPALTTLSADFANLSRNDRLSRNVRTPIRLEEEVLTFLTFHDFSAVFSTFWSTSEFPTPSPTRVKRSKRGNRHFLNFLHCGTVSDQTVNHFNHSLGQAGLSRSGQHQLYQHLMSETGSFLLKTGNILNQKLTKTGSILLWATCIALLL